MCWLRRTFLTGIIVTVPLIITWSRWSGSSSSWTAIATPVSARVLGRACRDWAC